MPPEPARKTETADLMRMPSIEDMAKARFGDTDGLAIVQKTTLELAQHYADRFSLSAKDPEVSIITAALAFTRHKEFLLLVEVERSLYTRISESPSRIEYGQVLFNVTKTGAFKEIYREIDRLHGRAGVYLRELKELTDNAQSR